jgi:hypothetical protein
LQQELETALLEIKTAKKITELLQEEQNLLHRAPLQTHKVETPHMI